MNKDTAHYEKVTDKMRDSRLQTSDILNASVRSKDNTEVGTVTDFEINKDGEIEALYVELEDGVLGLFGNTVVRADYNNFTFDPDKDQFRVKESFGEQFSNFISSFIEETKEAVDYAADNTEKGLRTLVDELEGNRRWSEQMRNVKINVENDRVLVRGEVKSREARDRIIGKIEDNTRLDVVDQLEIKKQ